MIPLLLYLMHCFAAFALFGVWGSRQFGLLGWMIEAPDARRGDFLLLIRRTRVFTWLLVGLEAATGLALILLPNWRGSGFLWAFVLMIFGWVLAGGVSRPLARRINTPHTPEKLRLVGWLCGANLAARAVILILVGTV
jgi:hypothetical protein